jgi:hypothetical protein
VERKKKRSNVVSEKKKNSAATVADTAVVDTAAADMVSVRKFHPPDTALLDEMKSRPTAVMRNHPATDVAAETRRGTPRAAAKSLHHTVSTVHLVGTTDMAVAAATNTNLPATVAVRRSLPMAAADIVPLAVKKRPLMAVAADMVLLAVKMRPLMAVAGAADMATHRPMDAARNILPMEGNTAHPDAAMTTKAAAIPVAEAMMKRNTPPEATVNPPRQNAILKDMDMLTLRMMIRINKKRRRRSTRVEMKGICRARLKEVMARPVKVTEVIVRAKRRKITMRIRGVMMINTRNMKKDILMARRRTKTRMRVRGMKIRGRRKRRRIRRRITPAVRTREMMIKEGRGTAVGIGMIDWFL